MPVLNTMKSKQCSDIWPCLKCNAWYVDQTRITYRPKERKLKKKLIIETEIYINVQTKNIIKYD